MGCCDLLMMMTLSSFYLALGVIMWVIWLAGTLAGGADLHSRGLKNPLCMVPSLVPRGLLVGVLRRGWLYRCLCHAPPAFLVAASLWPESTSWRWCAALSFTSYALVETSVTHSHRDYPAMYALWVLAVCGDDARAEGLVLGIAVHLMISSGIAKLRVGGRAWCLPRTMRGVLSQYVGKGGADGPLVVPLARAAIRSDAALFAFGAGTLVFECVVVPLGLLSGSPKGASPSLLNLGVV